MDYNPLHQGQREFCMYLLRALMILKISWNNFNLSKATKEAITKNHSLCTWQQTKKNVLSNPQMTQLFCCKPFLGHSAGAFSVFICLGIYWHIQ